MSMWMWENHCRGTGIGCKAAAGCLVTLALEQVWQSLTHCVTSLLMQDHITLWPIVLLVAFARGGPCCERRRTLGGGVRGKRYHWPQVAALGVAQHSDSAGGDKL